MDDRQKIPVPRYSFLWSLNETSGEILTHVGPTEFTPSANDRIVWSNSRGGYEQATMEARPFVLVRDGEYVLLVNPRPVSPDNASSNPNGEFVPGGNKERPLLLGTTKVIPGPCAFPMWPGQSAEVRPAHKLGANHYLIVEVVGPVDDDAPYYQLLVESAELSSAVIDSADGESEEHRTGQNTKLRLGQRIVIQGRHTQIFIPPTGTMVVPATEEHEERSEDDGLSTLPPSQLEELTTMSAQIEAGLTNRQFSILKNELRHRDDLSSGQKAIMLTSLDNSWEKRLDARAKKASDRADRRAGRPLDPYSRKAVVLGPNNFCYLYDADGHPRIVRGSARVFPGPHDTFRQRGSRRRVYDAYQLGEHQALWVRIIAPVSASNLKSLLPAGHVLDKELYEAGDELLVRGQPSVFFPFIQGEVLNPRTREPHIGNDHENVIISAIGIDQKSGIYVRDLDSGRVKMIRGETSYLVDPRREEHVTRRISKEQWNLWVAHGETRKVTLEDVQTPWALSVVVPNNEAIHITSRHGQRVVVGPCTELLEYEERLTTLLVSRDANYSSDDLIQSSFLRVRGGRFVDGFEVESQDFVKIALKFQVAYHFEGDKERWFNVEAPSKLLAETLRAQLRDAARKVSATDLLVGVNQLFKQSLFGDDSRFLIADNNMIVHSLDVIQVSIVDSELSSLFTAAQTEAVSFQLKDRQASRRLLSAQHNDTVDAQEHELQRKSHSRAIQTEQSEKEDAHQMALRQAELQSLLEGFVAERAQASDRARIEHELVLAKLQTEAKVEAIVREAEAKIDVDRKQNNESVVFETARAEIERETARVFAEADAVRLQAIQKELVAALHAASDSEVMKAAAENMNLVALLGGKSPVELLAKTLEGTPLVRTSNHMQRRAEEEDAE